MRFESKLAWKYFRARRKSLARFTSLVAVFGIASGAASLIVALALSRGFADEMRDKILANTAHVSIFSSDETEISDWREIKQTLEKLVAVGEVSAATYESSIIVGADAANHAVLKAQNLSIADCGLRIAELETEGRRTANDEQRTTSDERQTTNNERRTTNDEQTIKICVGARLAEKINVKAGDSAELVILKNGSEPRREKVFVSETFQTGLFDYDSTWITVSPENFASLHDKKNFTPTVLNVSIRDIYGANETAEKIRTALGERFKVVSWQEANKPLFAALSLERRVALAIISLIIFVAALNITTTLALLVNERRLDIAVLRACGARTKSLLLIFLFEGALLSVPAIFIGAVFGLSACYFGNRFKIISLSEEVYSLNSIPFHAALTDVLPVIFITFVLCLLASVYPAFRASRIKPLENLRTLN